jgi:hypothetical protein
VLGGREAGGVLERFGAISIGVQAVESVAGAASSSPNRCSRDDISPKRFDKQAGGT